MTWVWKEGYNYHPETPEERKEGGKTFPGRKRISVVVMERKLLRIRR
jgi:hypothetical protein